MVQLRARRRKGLEQCRVRWGKVFYWVKMELRSLTIHKEIGEWAVVSGAPTGKRGPVGWARQARGRRPASQPMATRGQRGQEESNLPAVTRQELPQGSEKKKECELPGDAHGSMRKGWSNGRPELHLPGGHCFYL